MAARRGQAPGGERALALLARRRAADELRRRLALAAARHRHEPEHPAGYLPFGGAAEHPLAH
eukprot:scaffold54369_cov39-Phaeocystis_antarctica.AAC.2